MCQAFEVVLFRCMFKEDENKAFLLVFLKEEMLYIGKR